MTHATQPGNGRPHHDAADGGGLPLHRLLASLRRQALWIAGSAALVLALTVWLTLKQQPVYQAQASLRIEDPATGGGAGIPSPYRAQPTIETEIEILQSRSVAEDVVATLGLNGAPGTPHADAAAASATAEAIRRGITVSRPQVNARLVIVSYESSDPAGTRDIVNAVTRAYIERRNQMQKQQAHATVQFLRAQMEGIGAQLRDAEGALEAFRRTNAVVDPGAQSSDQVRRLADMRARREELEFQRGALRDVLAKAGQPGDTASWAALASTPALIGNNPISDVLQQLTSLETEAARLAGWRTTENPDTRALQRIIDNQTQRLGTLARQQLAVLDDQARQQDSLLGSLTAAIGRIPETELRYVRLRRQVDLISGLYTLLQTRLKEAEITEAVEAANIQIVDAAVLPTTPIRPRKAANLVFGALAGVLLGLVVALARELSDTVVRSREEVASITDLPVLASIPRQAFTTNGNGNGHSSAHSLEGRLVTRHSPRSPAAEAYRALRTSIAFSSPSKQRALVTLVVTSAEPQAGKSTTAVNLAVALAEQGKHVLLLEADQRRPILHRVLGVERVPGLTDVVAGRATLAAVTRTIPLPEHATGRLDFIPGGTTVPNPAELAGSAPMRALLADLATRYDVIVLDTPPMSLVTDAAVAGTGADGVILVARMGATHREALRRAVEELRGIGAPIVGMVLTDVRQSEDRYGQYSGQYYGKAYAEETEGA